MSALEYKDLKPKYDIIVSKLRAAIARNKAAFPQLSLISTYLGTTLAEADEEEDYLQRLEGLCAYLHELSSTSYVIRHLHHNLCSDVESAKNNSAFFNQSKDYISLPK
ncbi:hypothetical protein [Pontibacter pamirensis]|uniref:hypothetical protein n=1 Tax=Pontibacter pamirensis TaxID=2562824 RepID=UPI00138A6681|nr:hypothetical protein [Pontibacter pamirensis]